MASGGKTSLVALDLNATRVQAVSGTGTDLPSPVLLAGPGGELPTAISLEGRHPVVGAGALGSCREQPHLVCHRFLAELGSRRQWAAGRHRLDAAHALALTYTQVQPHCLDARGVMLTLPAYLDDKQMQAAALLAEKARLHVLGWLTAPLAAALTAYTVQPWMGLALVVDVDEHALTWTAVVAEHQRLTKGPVRVAPRLGLSAWKDRLIDAVADRCVRQSRRDFRDSGSAEQGLYDQLEPAMTACQEGKLIDLVIRTANWCQNLILRPEEWIGFGAGQARKTLEEMHYLQQEAGGPAGPPEQILVTAAAARLPGLMAALEEVVRPTPPRAVREPSSDFGDGLLDNEATGPLGIHVLAGDAAARAALNLGCRILRKQLSRGALVALPLPPAEAPDSGPVRLHYQGQDYHLGKRPFALGRHPDCDLVFDSALHPTVSARHCEILLERQTYLLRDQSRHGTLVNNRPVIEEIPLQPGDWIRLGPGGPQVRFLGQGSVSSGQWSVVSG
jgi:hypothetical protein